MRGSQKRNKTAQKNVVYKCIHLLNCFCLWVNVVMRYVLEKNTLNCIKM